MQDDIKRVVPCQVYGKKVSRADMLLVTDRYGIPYKLVCQECYPEVSRKISRWKHDVLYAGERLK